MRTRTRWAWYCVLGVSALWGVVVCLYSVGRDRECKRLAGQFESLAAGFSNLLTRVSDVERSSVDSPISESESSYHAPATTFKPRLLGVGQTHSPTWDYIYMDIQYGSNDVRRSYKRVAPRTNVVSRL